MAGSLHQCLPWLHRNLQSITFELSHVEEFWLWYNLKSLRKKWLKVGLCQHAPASPSELSITAYIHTQKNKKKQVHFVGAGVRKCLAKRHLAFALQPTSMLAS